MQNRSHTLPKTYDHKVGKDISTRRGQTKEGIKLFSFDVVPKCVNGSCPALQYCDFEKTTKEKEVRCGATTQYMRARAESIFRNHGHYLSEDQFHKIGLELTPLYRSLCKMKLEELSISKVVTTSDRGVMKSNPIYKEIRETLKAIQAVRNDIGLDEGKARKTIPQNEDDLTLTPAPDFSQPGSYYEVMAEGKHKTKRELRKEAEKNSEAANKSDVPDKPPEAKLNLRGVE